MSKLNRSDYDLRHNNKKGKQMKTFFDATKTPTQNTIVLAYFKGLLGPHVGKYQDDRLVFLNGYISHDWSDVCKWRYSNVKDSSALVVADKPKQPSR